MLPPALRNGSFPHEANNVATPMLMMVSSMSVLLTAIFMLLDEATGQESGNFTGGNWFWAKPVAINGIIFAPSLDSKVYGLDAKTGKN